MDAKAQREKAKLLAEERRNERKNRKRHCVICGIEESEKTPFVPHEDGIGPVCRDVVVCKQYAASSKFARG